MDTTNLELGAAAALRGIARNEAIKSYLLNHEVLYGVLSRAARRFIGGETLEECLRTAKEINARGHAVTIDYMGENTRDAVLAQQATEEFLRASSSLQEQQIDGSISLDLSHIGLAIDPEMALQNARVLVAVTESAGQELVISAEGAERTDSVLDAYGQLAATHANLGITVQASFFRTAHDLPGLLGLGKLRLVKGAFMEPDDLALPRGPELDAAYRTYLEQTLIPEQRLSIATHDTALLDYARQLIEERSLDRDLVEFEMLQGVRPDLLADLQARGYRTRVYLPYGRDWYLYLCHRLAEYPPNLYAALIDAVGDTSA